MEKLSKPQMEKLVHVVVSATSCWLEARDLELKDEAALEELADYMREWLVKQTGSVGG